MGIILFDLRPHGGSKRPKTPLRGQKRHEGFDLLKKVFNKSCLPGPIRFKLQPQGKKL